MKEAPELCIIGDIHGHLQLALCVAARQQRERGVTFDAVLLCGDVSTFTADAELDSTTRRHAKANPCELEFFHQWTAVPPLPHLVRIFMPVDEVGLGLTCPVVMVHGNHEGFAHLRARIPAERPSMPVPLAELPAVDSGGWIRYLPNGWVGQTPAGLLIGGVGGIERDQRTAAYDELAYLDDDAVLSLLMGPRLDVLLTHQGPSQTQGPDKGSRTLQLLLDEGRVQVWFHGHSIPDPAIRRLGPGGGTLVVPLGDVAFPGRGPAAGDPGEDAWCLATMADDVTAERGRPTFWRDYRRRKWAPLPDGQLVCPNLAPYVSSTSELG